MKKVKLLSILALSVSSVLLAGNGYAATATTTFSVTATVVPACTASVGATALAFSTSIDPTASPSTSYPATNTITVTCTSGTSYHVALNEGQNGGGSTLNRAMSSGANLLKYDLFQDSSHTSHWGNSSSNTDTVAGLGTGSSQAPLTVYGYINSVASATPPGNYSDTITVAVNY